MPYRSLAQEKYFNANRARLERQGVNVNEWNKASKGRKLPMRAKKKYKISVNNKLKSYGVMDTKTNRIQINVRAHKKNGKIDRAELASSLAHEIRHVTHPKETEKQVYKATAKTKLSHEEQSKYIAKLRHKKLNYQSGALKRKYKLGRGDVSPGTFISQMNAQKTARNKDKSSIPVRKLEIMGAA